ncbi:family 20 glycosylhydrolase [Hoylesella shahii]|uniref:family 20 glycosylhydrolase n=1 Tax=Hoylesella shahii TaxID=228603 RepID=UPI0004722A6F|nr:family 20 glycosylhydrolase [Hoylesella shahii]
MVDTGRNFIPHTQLKAYINLLSLFKVNVFHWHLTDNPAWRIECKVYPQLNDPQYQRKGRDEGKFYTYNQIREVIAYAKSLGVSVIPEIDMPGHSQYFDKTFGFGMATEKGKQVLKHAWKSFSTRFPRPIAPLSISGATKYTSTNPPSLLLFAKI